MSPLTDPRTGFAHPDLAALLTACATRPDWQDRPCRLLADWLELVAGLPYFAASVRLPFRNRDVLLGLAVFRGLPIPVPCAVCGGAPCDGEPCPGCGGRGYEAVICPPDLPG